MAQTITYDHTFTARYVNIDTTSYGPHFSVTDNNGECVRIRLEVNGQTNMQEAIVSEVRSIGYRSSNKESYKAFLEEIIKEATDTLRKWEEEEATV